MSDKPGGNPFQLDKKELLKDAPLGVKAFAGPVIDYINHLDLNHDHKADIAQVAPFAIKAMPFAMALAPLIDWEAALENLLKKYCKDEAQARRIAEKLLSVGAEAAEQLQKK